MLDHQDSRHKFPASEGWVEAGAPYSWGSRPRRQQAIDAKPEYGRPVVRYKAMFGTSTQTVYTDHLGKDNPELHAALRKKYWKNIPAAVFGLDPTPISDYLTEWLGKQCVVLLVEHHLDAGDFDLWRIDFFTS